MQPAAAQTGGTVTGVLKEKLSGEPMEYATVALWRAATDGIENGCMTDSNGAFVFEKVPAGKYFVEGRYVGCDSVRSDTFTLVKGQHINLGVLYMSGSGSLDEIVVEGRREALVAKLDRKVFNVGQDLMSTVGSAGDLMQNIPTVDFDLDGNVSLRGLSLIHI